MLHVISSGPYSHEPPRSISESCTCSSCAASVSALDVDATAHCIPLNALKMLCCDGGDVELLHPRTCERSGRVVSAGTYVSKMGPCSSNVPGVVWKCSCPTAQDRTTPAGTAAQKLTPLRATLSKCGRPTSSTLQHVPGVEASELRPSISNIRLRGGGSCLAAASQE